MFLKDNKHIEMETLGANFPDPSKFSILSEEWLTQFWFDKVFEIDAETDEVKQAIEYEKTVSSDCSKFLSGKNTIVTAFFDASQEAQADLPGNASALVPAYFKWVYEES